MLSYMLKRLQRLVYVWDLRRQQREFKFANKTKVMNQMILNMEMLLSCPFRPHVNRKFLKKGKGIEEET